MTDENKKIHLRGDVTLKNEPKLPHKTQVVVRSHKEIPAVLATGCLPVFELTWKQRYIMPWRLRGRPPKSSLTFQPSRPRGRPPKKSSLEKIWESISLKDKIEFYAERIKNGEFEPDPGPRRREDGTFDEFITKEKNYENRSSPDKPLVHNLSTIEVQAAKKNKRPICRARGCSAYLKKHQPIVCSAECALKYGEEARWVLDILT